MVLADDGVADQPLNRQDAERLLNDTIARYYGEHERRTAAQLADLERRLRRAQHGGSEVFHDREALLHDLRSDADPNLRKLFQDVFFNTNGRKALAYLLMRFGVFTPELLTERDRGLRNAGAILLYLCGFTENHDAIASMLKSAERHPMDIRRAMADEEDQEEQNG